MASQYCMFRFLNHFQGDLVAAFHLDKPIFKGANEAKNEKKS